jgi:hypothetical protein
MITAADITIASNISMFEGMIGRPLAAFKHLNDYNARLFGRPLISARWRSPIPMDGRRSATRSRGVKAEALRLASAHQPSAGIKQILPCDPRRWRNDRAFELVPTQVELGDAACRAGHRSRFRDRRGKASHVLKRLLV